MSNLFSAAKKSSAKLKLLEEKLNKLEDKKKSTISTEATDLNEATKLNSVNSSTNATFSNKDRALEAKVEQLEKQVIKLQEENRVLESYEKRSRERLEKMQQEQSVASEKAIGCAKCSCVW